MFVDLLWLAEFLELVSQLKGIYDQLVELAEGEDPPDVLEMTDAQRLQALKDATLLVHRLRLDIACYPLTDASVVFLGSNGEPIPLDCLS